MYPTNPQMLFMNPVLPHMPVPYGLAMIGFGAAVDMFTNTGIGPGEGPIVLTYAEAGIMGNVAMHGAEDTGSNQLAVFNAQLAELNLPEI